MKSSNNVALYIGADPFTFNDLDIVKKSIQTFGFINIFLDRKNRDSEYKRYLLTYSDRSDIIKHDLKDYKITEYKIIPLDETLEKTMKDNDISTLVLNFDYQASIDFRMMKILQYVNPDINIFLVRGNGYIEQKFIKTLLDADSSMNIYKNFCSEYSFLKLKLKTMFKVGITGKIGCDYEKCRDIFEDHGYKVIDVDEFIRKIHLDTKSSCEISNIFSDIGIYSGKITKEKIIDLCSKDKNTNRVFQEYLSRKINQKLASDMSTSFTDKIAVIFSMMVEFGFDSMMDKNICIKTDEKSIKSNLTKRGYTKEYMENLASMQMDLNEKTEYVDYIVDEGEMVSDLIKILNTKINKG